MYFHKFTQTMKAIVSSTAPLTGEVEMETKTIGGVEVEVRKQQSSEEVKFGFTAINPQLAAQMVREPGDELALTITDKPVVNTQTGEVIPNLFWAE